MTVDDRIRWIPEVMHKPGIQHKLTFRGYDDDLAITFEAYYVDKNLNKRPIKDRRKPNIKRKDRQRYYMSLIQQGRVLPTKKEEDLGWTSMEKEFDYDESRIPIERVGESGFQWGKPSQRRRELKYDIGKRAELTEKAIGELELKPIDYTRDIEATKRAIEAGAWTPTGVPATKENRQRFEQLYHPEEILFDKNPATDRWEIYVLDKTVVPETVTPAPLFPWQQIKDPITGKVTTSKESATRRLERIAKESREARTKDLIEEELKYMSEYERERLGIGESGSVEERAYLRKQLQERMGIFEGKIPKEWRQRDKEIARAIEVSGYPYEMLSKHDKLIHRMRMEDIQEAYRKMTPVPKITVDMVRPMLERLPEVKEYLEQRGVDVDEIEDEELLKAIGSEEYVKDAIEEALEAEYDPETLALIKALRNEGYPEQYIPSAAQLESLTFNWDEYYNKYGYLFDQTSGGDFYLRKAQEYRFRTPKIEGMREKLGELGYEDKDVEMFLERPDVAMEIIGAGMEAPKLPYGVFPGEPPATPMEVASESREVEEEQQARVEGEPMRTYEEVIQEQVSPPMSFVHETPSGETTLPTEYFEHAEHWSTIDDLERLGYDKEAQKALGFCEDQETCQYIIDHGITPEYLAQIAEESEEQLKDAGMSEEEVRILSGLKDAYGEMQESDDTLQERAEEEELRYEEMESEYDVVPVEEEQE